MENRYITVQYKLYAPMGKEQKTELIEETRPDVPFQFISGMGMVLDALENYLRPLEAGTPFKITLTEDEAYGPYIQEGVQEVPVEAFFIDGKLDNEHIYEGAIVPLVNSEGERFNGTVAEIKEKVIVVDLNHPLAGKALTFEGTVTENREATNKEIQDYLNSQSGCGGCGGCGGGNCGEGGCGGGCKGGCGGCD
ncbi:MAG: peptidylprolyl isomerase [Bacteroidaceae bacterium]|nr:peptidylprolyl isomerase [Bacteroidaceae bacterium]